MYNCLVEVAPVSKTIINSATAFWSFRWPNVGSLVVQLSHCWQNYSPTVTCIYNVKLFTDWERIFIETLDVHHEQREKFNIHFCQQIAIEMEYIVIYPWHKVRERKKVHCILVVVLFRHLHFNLSYIFTLHHFPFDHIFENVTYPILSSFRRKFFIYTFQFFVKLLLLLLFFFLVRKRKTFP